MTDGYYPVTTEKELRDTKDETSNRPLSAELQYHTCGQPVKHLMCDSCYGNNMENLKQEVATKAGERVLNEVFSSMDVFFGNIPTDANIIKWAVSKQDSFVTAAMSTYLHSRELRKYPDKNQRASPCVKNCPSCPIQIYNSCGDMINPDSVKP